MRSELWQAARIKALQEGRELADVVRELLARWVAGDMELQDEQPRPPE